MKFDVFIIGGGPAGTALALTLLRHAPWLKLGLAEASAYEHLRIGETIPPSIQALLAGIGVWPAFEAQEHLPSYGTRSVWGGPHPYENEFLWQTSREGWHVDRRKFDLLLAEQAQAAGCQLFLNSKVQRCERQENGWAIALSGNDTATASIRAKWVVDASGRQAWLAARQGAVKIRQDRLTAAFQLFEFPAGAPEDASTLVEAVEDGWWYSAQVPGGKMAVSMMSDSEIIGAKGLKDFSQWSGLLNGAKYTRQRLQQAKPLGPVVIRSAASFRLDRVYGEGWLAVGDAACGIDPLSSQGIFKALHSGTIGGYALLDEWSGKTEAGKGLARYQSSIFAQFNAFLEKRRDFYREEMRWPNAPFWKDKHEFISLSPNSLLQKSAQLKADKHSRNRPRFTPTQWNRIAELTASPIPAMELVQALQQTRKPEAADFGLIAGIQHLILHNYLSITPSIPRYG